MAESWERSLERWVAAGLIDREAAGRIRAFEDDGTDSAGLRWPALVALALGALLIGAGTLLLVSAHWDGLSPFGRMVHVVVLVSIFHAAGAYFHDRFPPMVVAMHALGTIALGAGIALTGQIFNLHEDWAGGALLWAIGAAVGYVLLKQWPQSALLALLAPFWLVMEWARRHPGGPPELAATGCAMLAFTYLSARVGERADGTRQALVWIGSIGLIPSVALANMSGFGEAPAASGRDWLAWAIAIAVPLALALLLRGRAAVYNVAACVWALLLAAIPAKETLGLQAWVAAGAVGLVAWGIAEKRPERVNLGVAGFAITVLVFYFSNVMDKMGRSASLIGLGILFLAGGYGLERVRRRLMARIAESER